MRIYIYIYICQEESSTLLSVMNDGENRNIFLHVYGDFGSPWALAVPQHPGSCPWEGYIVWSTGILLGIY